MKKLNLNLEDLKVESFDTLPRALNDQEGTVQGYGTPPLISCGETACDETCLSCDPSCNGTCQGNTCEGTCGRSCGGTCGHSCGGTCNTCGGLSCVPTCFNWPGCETGTLP